MMSEEDKEILEVGRAKLMRHITLEDGLLLAELRARKVITQHQEECMQAGPNTIKVGKLVDFLLRGNSNTLGHFKQAMLATNHTALLEECFGSNTATDLPTGPPLHLTDPEYVDACKLAKNDDARGKFLERLRKKSEGMKPRGSLLEVVQNLGYGKKLLVYLVHEAPDICEQIGRLFVIKRVQVEGLFCWEIMNFNYYIELLKTCEGDAKSTDTLIRALVDAEVTVDQSTPLPSHGSHGSIADWFYLLQHLNNEQCAALLDKTHNLQLCVKDGQQSTLTSKEETLVASEFVLGVVYLYNCAITADCLDIRDLDMPVSMLTRNISGVKRLRLVKCRLCDAFPGYMPTRNKSSALKHQQPSREECFLEEVEFCAVKGMTHLRHCEGIITTRPCRLHLSDCDDVKVTDLKKCFPKIEQLDVKLNTVQGKSVTSFVVP